MGNDGATWKELALLFGAGLIAIGQYLYRQLSGRINSMTASLEESKVNRAKLSERVSVLEQHSADQHHQVIETLELLRADVREMRQGADEQFREMRDRNEVEFKELSQRLGRVESICVVRHAAQALTPPGQQS